MELGLVSVENVPVEFVENATMTEDSKIEPEKPARKANVNYAPDILELRTEEKLTDDNVYDIEVRGERDSEKIYFKVKDISSELGMPNLRRVITDKSSNYIDGRHYTKFYCDDVRVRGENNASSPKESGNRNRLFLTYDGFLKLLYSSSNQKCDKFVKWVRNVVFTAHLGTKAQKQALAGQLLGVDRQTVRAVFNKSTTEQSCIYLIYLGKVSELRVPFEIGADFDDNSGVYKYGRAISLDQHQAHYGKLLGCDMKLTKYAPIDPIYNVEAENDIKDFFVENEYKLDNKKHIELVILDKPGLRIAKNAYKRISDEYMGHYSELNNKVKVLEETCRANVAEARLEASLEVAKARTAVAEAGLRANEKSAEAKLGAIEKLAEVNEKLAEVKQELAQANIELLNQKLKYKKKMKALLAKAAQNEQGQGK